MRLSDPTTSPRRMSSSYLSTFMLGSGPPAASSSDEEARSYSFPRHPAKRKRTISSNSSSDCEVVVRQPVKQYSRVRTSSQSNKSGTVYGSFGKEKPCYRPKFPSDDSDDFKSSSPAPCPDAELEETDEQTDKQTDKQTDNTNKRILAQVDPENIVNPSPVKDVPGPKIRPERSAATKAQFKMKEFLPKGYKKNDVMYELVKYRLDPELLRALPYPLQMGYKLYAQLRNDGYLRHDLVPFLEPVDATTEETKDYYKKISKPICLSQIEKKLQGLDYFSTPEIIADIRQMLENCHRFNGPEAWICPLACKIEMALEQQIALLPYTIRGKCGLSETSPHLTLYRDVCGRRTRTPRIHADIVGNKSPIMLALEDLELYKQKEAVHLKAQLTIRQKAKLDEDATTIASFVSNNEDFKTICNSPELISSCVMICVCQEYLELPFTVGALELGLLYPRHSPYLANLMVRLCCGEKLIKEIKRTERLATYEAWNKFVAQRVNFFYFAIKTFGRYVAVQKKGVTLEFLRVFGTSRNPLLYSDAGDTKENGAGAGVCTITSGMRDTIRYNPQNIRHFHELSVTERLTLLHCLCVSKTVMSTRCLICFDEYDPDRLRRRNLGKDGFGNIYFDFPMWPEEIRVYVEIARKDSDENIGDVRCVARSLDELESLITQIKENAVPDALKGVNGPEKKRRGQKQIKSYVTASFLQARLQDIYNINIEHKEHHSLVESTIFKEVAEKTIDLDNVEPDRPPPTPPRPSTPIEQDVTSSPGNVTSSPGDVTSSPGDVTSSPSDVTSSPSEGEEDKQESEAIFTEPMMADSDVEIRSEDQYGTVGSEISEKMEDLGINSSEISTENNHINDKNTSSKETSGGNQETVA